MMGLGGLSGCRDKTKIRLYTWRLTMILQVFASEARSGCLLARVLDCAHDRIVLNTRHAHKHIANAVTVAMTNSGRVASCGPSTSARHT